MSEGASEYSLLVAFPDESASFVNGWEAGELWGQMRRGDSSEIETTTHRENREVIQRMAIADGWLVEIAPTEINGWDSVKLSKRFVLPERPNPHGLRIVSHLTETPKRG